MIDPTTPKGNIISAALRLAGRKPWQQVSMIEIAEEAAVSLVDLRKEFGSKSAVVSAFMRAIDDTVLARATKPLSNTAPRDALFEVVMSRFDALTPYKPGVKSIVSGVGLDTDLARRMFASQAWMLNAAGIPLNGMAGTVRVFGLASVYMSVFRTWLEDDDAGLAKTMAALDRRLRRGEQSLQTLDGLCNAVSSFWRGATTPRTAKPEPAPDVTPGSL